MEKIYTLMCTCSCHRPLFVDLRPSHGQRSPRAFSEQPAGRAPGLRTSSGASWRGAFWSHLAGFVLREFHKRSPLLGDRGVQALGVRRCDVPGHPTQGERQDVHAGNEWAFMEPAAERTPAHRLAWQPWRTCIRWAAVKQAASAYRHAAGLWRRHFGLLWGEPSEAAHLPLHLFPWALSCLLDRGGGQRHSLHNVNNFFKAKTAAQNFSS